MAEIDPEDIIVTVAHPHGDIEVTLADWIRTGPGPRPFVRPVTARRKSSGEPLPMREIPLKYRNTRSARVLIKMGLLEDPWNRA